MTLTRSLKFLAFIILVLLWAGACEAPRTYVPPPQPTYYYVTATSTYVRSCPSYGDECDILTQVFAGDRMELLDRNDYGWSRVRVAHSGVVGWIVSDLLSLSPTPATYYVAVNSEYLRECGDYNCRALELLYRGDRVEKIDQDNRGWWRVISLKSRNQGWIPVMAVSPRPGPPFYYVNTNGLALRQGPSTATPIIYTLGLNNQVEMLGMGSGGWSKVRDVRRGAIGWVATRYLESFPVRAPRPVPVKHRAPAKKEAPEQPEEPPAKPPAPKIM